jgi:hypothetical protein
VTAGSAIAPADGTFPLSTRRCGDNGAACTLAANATPAITPKVNFKKFRRSIAAPPFVVRRFSLQGHERSLNSAFTYVDTAASKSNEASQTGRLHIALFTRGSQALGR